MTETWKSIPGFPQYEASDRGRIRRVYIQILRPHRSGSTGYAQVSVRDELGKKCTKTVHGLVARTFLGKRPKGYDVNHKDRDRMNASVENLEYMTRQENNRLRWMLHHPCGETCTSSKITESQVRYIRELATAGYVQTDLAWAFGLSTSQTCAIINGRSWRHVL